MTTRHPASLDWCTQIGTALAADGRSPEEVHALLLSLGRSPEGIIYRRVQRAYREQLALGEWRQIV